MVIATSNDYVAAPLEMVAPQATVSPLPVAAVILINTLVEVVKMVPWARNHLKTSNSLIPLKQPYIFQPLVVRFIWLRNGNSAIRIPENCISFGYAQISTFRLNVF